MRRLSQKSRAMRKKARRRGSRIAAVSAPVERWEDAGEDFCVSGVRGAEVEEGLLSSAPPVMVCGDVGAVAPLPEEGVEAELSAESVGEVRSAVVAPPRGRLVEKNVPSSALVVEPSLADVAVEAAVVVVVAKALEVKDL